MKLLLMLALLFITNNESARIHNGDESIKALTNELIHDVQEIGDRLHNNRLHSIVKFDNFEAISKYGAAKARCVLVSEYLNQKIYQLSESNPQKMVFTSMQNVDYLMSFTFKKEGESKQLQTIYLCNIDTNDPFKIEMETDKGEFIDTGLLAEEIEERGDSALSSTDSSPSTDSLPSTDSIHLEPQGCAVNWKPISAIKDVAKHDIVHLMKQAVDTSVTNVTGINRHEKTKNMDRDGKYTVENVLKEDIFLMMVLQNCYNKKIITIYFEDEKIKKMYFHTTQLNIGEFYFQLL